ncbi:MAG: glycosyltransferase family 4 protein [Bdellovibrio sp.]
MPQNLQNKNILFLTTMDFTAKGIQVVTQTPSALAKAGWNVHYVVGRDNSPNGSYHYQEIINPPNVDVERFEIPYNNFFENIQSHFLRTVYSKIRGYYSVLQLTARGNRALRDNSYDIVYGFGLHGVLAANLLKIIYGRKIKVISRFFGIWDFYSYTLAQKKYLKQLFNWDVLLALYLPADLTIITNDGTQGDKALKFINSKALNNFKFWSNGVEEQKLPAHEVSAFKEQMGLKDHVNLVSVGRLVFPKRVDRGLQIVSHLVHHYDIKNIRYLIVGDGEAKSYLEQLAKDLKITQQVIFVGAVSNDEVKKYLNAADFFISAYDVSNVGNPLLEAIRANKIIFTLNNGDTGKWIQHGINGFIYDINESLIESISADMVHLIKDPSQKEKINHGIKKAEANMLWTWSDRMAAEVAEIDKLLPSRQPKEGNK